MKYSSRLPENFDYSVPLEPMRLQHIGTAQGSLKNLISTLVDSHSKKITREQKHKLRDCYRVILLNVLFNSFNGVYTGISLANRSYDKGTYWSSLGLSYIFVKDAVSRLEQDGLLHVFKGYYNPSLGQGKITRIFGTEKLFELVPLADFNIETDDDFVVLKEFPFSSEELPEDHYDLARLKKVNSFLNRFDWPLKAPMRIIYSGGPVRGGRIYSRFQNLPKSLRAELKISGHRTVELDFKANHLMMLLAGKVSPLPEDPYTDIAFEASTSREKVKKFFTASLGANDEEKAFNALKSSRVNRIQFDILKEAAIKLFPVLKDALFKDVGAMLQSLEGQIALDIMVEGAKAGIPVLPVHDSFITLAEHEDWLRTQMLSQWMNHVGIEVTTNIDKKK